MKKVWILEGFITPERIRNDIKDVEEMKCKATTDDQREDCDIMIDSLKKRIEKSPNGYWLGYVGRSIYSQFCNEAKSTLRHMKDELKFRVVKAEIEDNAKFWPGYVNPVENEGVLRYLMATLYR